MRLDPEILDGPPELGARVVLLARLADADDALAAFDDGAGGLRALPALRGALQRLRSGVELLAPALAGAVPEERLARVVALSRRAAASRDAEALAAWLHGIRSDLAAPYRGALDWLADRVERRRSAAEAQVREDAVRGFRAVAPRLRADLTGRRPARPGAPPSFAAALGAALRTRTRALREALLAAAGPADGEGLDRARAEAARVREGIDPLSAVEPKAAEASEALRPLCAALAEWRDAGDAEVALEAALLEARAEGVRHGAAALAGLRPGLLAVLRIAERRAADARAGIAEHLGAAATPVTDAAYAVVAALEGRAEHGAEAGPGSGPERRFLVTAIPPEAQGGDVEEIEQGWLPGDGRESVGTARSALGEQWFRASASGRNRPARVQPIARGEFESLWPLTEGRRVAKRRHLVAAAPGWCFDAYLDRPLVLAVAEDGNVEEPPPWLEPVLVREVSAERGYLDEALARRAPRRAG
jgi:hypothetical protein